MSHPQPLLLPDLWNILLNINYVLSPLSPQVKRRPQNPSLGWARRDWGLTQRLCFMIVIFVIFIISHTV